jgi:hypothetical protein
MRRKVLVSRRRNTCLRQGTNTSLQNVEQLDAQPDKPLADAWRKLSEPWRPLGQDSQAQTENLYSRLLKSRCLVSTKRQFTRLLFSSALKKVVSPARDDTFPRGFDLSLQSFSSTGSIIRASHQKNAFGCSMARIFLKNPKWIWPGTAFAVDGASEAARVFSRFFKSGCFACTRRAFSRARNHWKYKASESECFASTKHLFLGSYNYKFAKFHTTGNRDCKDSGNGLMDIRQNAFFNLQSARPKAPGGARRRQEEPESTRRHQEATGGARRRQEARGGARKHQEAPGGARRRQEAPGGTQQSPSRCQEAPSRRQQTPGGTRKHQ